MDPSRLQEPFDAGAVEERRVHISGLITNEEWVAPRALMDSALLLLIRSTAFAGPAPRRF